MQDNEKVADILNDLIKINNDRIEGYEKAIKDSKGNFNYDTLFNQMIEQSRTIRQELISELRTTGGELETNETTNSGKIYRAWMDVKTAFTGKSEASVLELCEFGEDAAQKAYKEALSDAEDMSADTRQLLMRQKDELKMSHDLIKRERDAQKANA